MLRLGLTGGIGSGKSTVATRLSEHGALVIDSDVLAREVVEPGTAGLAEIVSGFGTDVLAPDGALDRAKLAAKVFSDNAARARLNAIVHPRVGARTAELMAAAPSDAIVVHDVPLLVENGLGANYHLVIVVDTPTETRLRRLVRDRDMSEEDARARISAQATDAARRAAADVWLDNSGSRDEILAAVDKLWADRLVRYESNVRLHRPAHYGPPRLADPDPTWPAQAERLAARIRRAAGPLALRVDHIGSTAVPDLPAKDVIDLQLTVSTLDDADTIADPLTEAGFILRPDVIDDQPHTADPTQWQKRYHTSADPARLAHLHIRAAGTESWLFPLLFRDYLRANPTTRAEYTTLKRALSEQFATDDNSSAYATAKEPWFTTIYPHMQHWATDTHWQPPTT